MSRRLVIAIDCDDVLVLSAQAVVDGYNAMFDAHLQTKDVYNEATMDTWGTDDDNEAKLRFEAFLSSDMYHPIPPLPEAVAAVKKLALNHELHLVTGRAEARASETRGLIDSYFNGCFESIEYTNQFVSDGTVAKRRSKGEICAQLGADILIDDHIAHGRSVIQSGLKEVIIFGDYPWNQMDAFEEGMRRCRDWNEVEVEIERIAA